ncbi:MAG TPA: MFS transporter [Spirochaetia bacterium]|nr:MFS transporter [Spirochaetia bacterium]
MSGPRAAHKGRLSVFTPTLSLFLFAMILANLGGMMFFPFFAIYLRSFGFPVQTIGFYFTLSAVFPLLFQIAGGWISDRLGRLRSIAIGSAAGAVSWIGTLAAPFTGHPLPWFLAANAVGSITAALVAPSFDAFVAEQAEEGERGKVFAVVQSVFMVVGIAGPPLGGLVAERLSYQALAWISAGLYWIATAIRVAMAKMVAAKPGPGGAEAAGGAHQGFRAGLKAIWGLVAAGGLFAWLLAVDGTLDFAGKLSSDILPLYLKEIGLVAESRIGLLQGLSALVMALAMIPLGSFADRRGERLPIAAGCLLWALSSVVLWLGRSLPAYALSFLLSGLAGAAFQPAMQSLASKAVPERLRGLAFGFLGTSLGLFSFFAPALGGYLWKAVFPAFPFLLAGLLVALASPLVLRKLVAPRPAQAAEASPGSGAA